jgi:hypothetical protein
MEVFEYFVLSITLIAAMIFCLSISTSILSTLTSFKAGTIVISGVMVTFPLEDPLPEISLQHLHS